jgi:hypothetical protein
MKKDIGHDYLVEKYNFEETIKYLKKGYGKKPCKGIEPSCANCQSQWTIGFLKDHLDLIAIELEEKGYTYDKSL